MPEMDGYTLTTEIRKDERLKDLRVLLHSSLSGVLNTALVKKVRSEGGPIPAKIQRGRTRQGGAGSLKRPRRPPTRRRTCYVAGARVAPMPPFSTTTSKPRSPSRKAAAELRLPVSQ